VEQPAYPASADPAFNLTGGPSGATAATLAALGRPVLHHLDPAFGALYQRTAELLQQAFGTRESPVILPGEAVVGLEAAAASLIGPGDVVLNLVSGIYGRGYGEWARRYAREVVEVEVPYDSSVPATSVADAMRGRPDVTVVSVVHCETPTGTVNDLDAIAAVVAGHGALLIVDAVWTRTRPRRAAPRCPSSTGATRTWPAGHSRSPRRSATSTACTRAWSSTSARAPRRYSSGAQQDGHGRRRRPARSLPWP
jgi:histidinol-phosphate/aromatic aminotransferase/cobyric acid decarboxylase-like protein